MNKKELFEKFTEIKANTKRAKGIVASYIRSQRNGNSIYNAYVKPSSEKKMRLLIARNYFRNAKAHNRR